MSYKELKENAKNKAIDIFNKLSESNMSYGELVKYQDYFYKLGKRFGLLKEFKENGLL